MPVTIVNYRARFRSLVAQVLGKYAQRIDQRLAVCNIEAIAVEVGEHPLMRIEGVAVSKFNSVLNVAKFRTNRGRAGHRGIYMQPEAVFSTDRTHRGQRIQRVGRGCTNGRRNKEWRQTKSTVLLDLSCQ